MKKRILSFIRSIALSGIVFAIGYWISIENRIAGTLFLALYSTFMVVRAYRRPIPLGFLTAVLPGLMALCTYSIQSRVLDHGDSDLPMLGLLLGIVPGIIMGITHRVYPENGRIWAKKSFLYLLLWGISYLVTQTAAIAGIREISGGALAVTGFTSSSLMVLSLFLALKYQRGKRNFFNKAVSSAVVIGSFGVLIAGMIPVSSEAMKTTVRDAEEGLAVLVSHEDIVRHFPEFRNSREERWNLNSNPLFGTPGHADSSAVARYATRNVGRLDIQIWVYPRQWPDRDFLGDYFDKERYPHAWSSRKIFVCAANGDGINGSYEGLAEVEEGPWVVSIEYDDYSESMDVPDRLRGFAVFLDERLSEIEYGGTEGNGLADIRSTGEENRSSVRRDVADAAAAAALIQLLVAAIMAAAVSGASTAATAGMAEEPGYEDLNMSGETPLPERFVDPDTGEPLPEENGRYWVWGQWVDADEAQRWIQERKDAQAARSTEIDRRFADERADRQAESDAAHRSLGDRYDAATDTWYTADYDVARLSEAKKAVTDKFNAAMLEKNRRHAADRLRGMFADEGGDAGLVDEMIAAGRWDDVCNMFRDRVYQGIRDSVSQHAAERRWATAAQVGEYAATLVESASKAGIAVLAGPAGLAAGGATLTGMGAAAVATGAIGAAGETTGAVLEAADMYGRISGKNRFEIATHVAKGFAAGFLSGAKDGAIGVYCGQPGATRTVKVLLPAAGDFGETYLRTGDLSKAAQAGTLSAAGEYLGSKIDGIGGRLTREGAGTALSAATGGAGSYINGGSFGEGAIKGVVGRMGSRVGDAATQRYSGGLPGQQDSPDTAETVDASGTVPGSGDAEAKLRNTLDEAAAERKRIIPIEGQPKIIRDLHKSMKDVVEIDPATGARTTVKEVDAKMAFDQLGDTASSRSAKQADPELREAMIRTRQKRICDPPDQAAIDRVLQKPEVQAKMRPGDKLVMTGYSTPDSSPSLGADRDAIMCIMRTDPKTGAVQMIQLDGKHWHDIAYEEFQKHTDQFANRDADGKLTPETEPEYYRRLKELDYLRKRPLDPATIDRVQDQARQKIDLQIEAENGALKDAGRPPVSEGERQARIDAETKARIDRLNKQFLTDDQIRARAWAASRNQVFTDPYHVEASRDNSNQALAVVTAPDGTRKVERVEIGVKVDGAVQPILDAEGRVRMGPGIQEGQRGQREGLIDAESNATMWKVKPADYADGNLPEAIAQARKGIAQQIKFIDGQRAAGIPVPPLKDHVAEAMEILSDPKNATADPDTLQQVDTDIRSVRKPDGSPAYPGGIREAIEKIPEQNRVLDMAMRARSIPAPDEQAPALQAAETPAYTQQEEGPLASDAARSAMRGAPGNKSLPEAVPSPGSDPAPAETDELEEKIRKLDEERQRLARQISERKKQSEGEPS